MSDSDKELDEYIDWLQYQAATIGFPMNSPTQEQLGIEAKQRLNALIEKKVREATVDELKNLPIFTSRRTVTDKAGGVYIDNSEYYVTKYELQERLAQLQDNQGKR